MQNEKYKLKKYPEYFRHEIELFQGTEKQEEKEFYEKRKKGENDNYICQIIQQDLIDDFVIYVNHKNLPIQTTKIIPESIFETNSFLLKNEPSLIEYAAFYGSIQIFNYLKYNKVELSPSLWLYSIHGKSAEIISILEEEKVKPKDQNYDEYLKESIKCHHNDFAEYIINNLIDKNDMKFSFKNFDKNIFSYCFHYITTFFIFQKN